jgi:hypothetical protein
MEFAVRDIPLGMQGALASGVTTHCWCWRVHRVDGAVYGFSDHDRDLLVDGVTYLSGSGFGGAQIETREGMAPDQGDVLGALDGVCLTDTDLDAGLWAAASVEIWRVDWADVSQRVKTWMGELGEIRRVDGRFEADLLGLLHRLDAEVGRVFAKRCDASLGDERCGVSAGQGGYSLGCDKRFSTCRDRFGNGLNFRGFPYLVGNDVLQAYPAGEPVRDGGSRGLGG